LRKTARKASALLSAYYALMVAYRAEIFLWAVATALPLIMMGVWTEAGATGRFALSDGDFARYFIAVFIVRQLSVTWVIYEFEFHVVSGRLSPLLLQPMDPAWRWVTEHLGEQLARLPFSALLVVLAIWLFPAAIDGEDGGIWLPSIGDIVLALIATYAAFALRFLLQYSLSLLAFWVERVGAFERVLFTAYLFLSGMLAPLEVFRGTPVKETVYSIAMWTPFPYVLWFPARLLTGGDIPVVRGFAIVATWLLVLYGVNRWLWHRGLKHYSAMGA
jgi:ABC-2 type transport system permease protein